MDEEDLLPSRKYYVRLARQGWVIYPAAVTGGAEEVP